MMASYNELVEQICLLTQTVNKLNTLLEAMNAKLDAKDAIIAQLEQKNLELTERLNKNSRNSSKAPSSDGLKKPTVTSLREPSGKKAGAQKGHKGSGLKLNKIVSETIQHKPCRCENCPHATTCKACAVSAARYTLDANVEIQVVKHQVLAFDCPCLNGQRISGEFPTNVTSRLQYGDNLKALVIALNTSGMMGINRIHELLNSVFDVPIAVGTIAGMVSSFSGILSSAYTAIRNAVMKTPVVHFDETGLRAEGKGFWLHNASTDRLTCYSVQEKRGGEGMDAMGILPSFGGVAVHDCWAPYFRYSSASHALCCAHLLRELKGVIENHPDQKGWAQGMIALLLKMKKAKEEGKAAGQTHLSEEQYCTFTDEYHKLIATAFEQNPLENQTGKRGRPHKGKVRSLAERFAQYESEICLFTVNFAVPFDNNQAERDIRMTKVKQKVTGGFRTKTGAQQFATIMSYLSTLHKQGTGAYNAIHKALSGLALQSLPLV